MNKRGIAFETLARWIIALAVLVIIILGIMILKSRGTSLLDKFMEVFRFGR
jgi:cadmium resistance protein CadD (predicted permease)